MLGGEPPRDLNESNAGEIHAVNEPDCIGGLLNDFHCAGVLVFPISERRDDDKPVLLLLPEAGTDLGPDVLCVEVVHQDPDTDDEVVIFGKGIKPLGYGDHGDIALTQILDKQCRLRFMTAKPGQVFDKYGFYAPVFRRLGKLSQSGAGEGHSADIVIRGRTDNSAAVLLGVLTADALLISQ